MKTHSPLLVKRSSALSLIAALACGPILAETPSSTSDSPHSSPSVLSLPVDASSVPRDGLPRGSYAPIIKNVAPAVVKIVTTSEVKSRRMEGIPGFPIPFGAPDFQNAPPPNSIQKQEGLGSGVIVTKDGYILTNNHVVDGAKTVEVELQDGRQFTAKVIGRDAQSDIAVVKIEAQNLPTLPIADSDKLEVGDVALAVGNPFGVGQTVTQGIISALDRGDMGIEDYEDFIQTDAAINPGNSGGALVDIEGRLIGINTAILSRSGGSQGVGFAIPINLARQVMQSLVADGHVSRGFLGVTIQRLTADLAKAFKLQDDTGALIGEVLPGGPADLAGCQNGDVIVSLNGQKVRDIRQLRLAIAQSKPGAKITLGVMRNGELLSLRTTLKSLPSTEEVSSNDPRSEGDQGRLKGVGIGDLDEATRQALHLPKNLQGAIVTQVDPNSSAAEAGLKPGDIIEEVDRQPVKSADEAVKLTATPGPESTLLRVWENGGSHYLSVDERQKTG